MSFSIFSSSSPIGDHSIIATRRTTRANSTAEKFRTKSRSDSLSVSFVPLTFHQTFLNEALQQAKLSLKEGGIPIGSILVHDNQIIARGRHQRIQRNSNILHAEIDCLENVGRKQPSFYRNSILYTTCAPNAFVCGAIRFYRISHVVIGDATKFQGDLDTLRKDNVDIEILDCKQCQTLLDDYIAHHPDQWTENIFAESSEI